MKRTWFWTGWAHLTVVLVIGVNIGAIMITSEYLVGKFLKLVDDGVIDHEYVGHLGYSWMPALLVGVQDILNGYSVWIFLGAAVLVVLFEWLVKSPNKTQIRLSALGTLALGLTILTILIGAALVIPQLISGPVTSRMGTTFAIVQTETLDTSIRDMEKALANDDWEAIRLPGARASQAIFNLNNAPPALPGLWSLKSPSVPEMRTMVEKAVRIMAVIRNSIDRRDAVRVKSALIELRQTVAPLLKAAKTTR